MFDETTSPEPKPRISLELKLSNHWPKVELVRSAVTGFVRATMVPEGLVEDLSTASAELLENALKHAAPSPTGGDSIRFGLESDEEETRVIVSNLVDRGASKLDRLVATLETLRSSEDVEALYRERLEALYRGDAEAGVGLIRIGKLGCRVEHAIEDDVVTIVASFRSEGDGTGQQVA